ncbi:hypothetical protein [Bradyrhizobium sp.]
MKTAEDYADEFVNNLPEDMRRDRASFNWQVGLAIGEKIIPIIAECNAKIEQFALNAGMTKEQFDEISRR